MNLLSRIKDTRIFLRVLRHQTGGGFTHSGKTINTRADRFNHTSHDVAADPDALDATAISSLDDGRVIENPHPEKAAIPNRRPPRGIKRAYYAIRKNISFAKSVIFPTPSPEAVEAKAQLKKDRVIVKTILMDAARASRIMSNRWKELMFFQKVTDGQKTRIKSVKFDAIAYDWDNATHTGGNMIEFHIDTRPGQLPAGVRLTELLSPESLSEIQYSMEHPVKGWANIEGGIVKMMRSMNNGITSFVSIQDMWNAMPKNLPPLAFPVGIGESARHYHKDLDDCPHLLVVGATKQGKSNMINGILCTYLFRGLKPEQVQFILFDLKEGLEFSFFDGLPHLYTDKNITSGIIEELEDAIPAMEHIKWLMKARMEMIRKAGYKSINDYNMNHRGKQRIPSMIVCFDDYIPLSLTYGKKADDVLTVLSSQGRAAGIYIILGAQYPKSDQFPSIALINFPVVIAFRLKPGASRSILNSNAAVELACRGRACFQDFDEENEIQTPRISDSIIRACVDGAKTGKKPLQATKIDIEEVLAYALEHMDGFLNINKLFMKYKGKISHNKLSSMISLADEQVYDVNGTLYRVTGYPRHLVLADEETTEIITDVNP